MERRVRRPTIVRNVLVDPIYDRAERAALVSRLVAFASVPPAQAGAEIDRAATAARRYPKRRFGATTSRRFRFLADW